MKMTCNGGVPRTLQAAFEINISTLRSREWTPRVAGVSRADHSPRKGKRSTLDIKTEKNVNAGGVTNVHRVLQFRGYDHVTLD